MTNKRPFSVLILFLMIVIIMILPQNIIQAQSSASDSYENRLYSYDEDEKIVSSTYMVFLPMLTNGNPTPTTIMGKTTLNGNPYAGVVIELYFFDSYGDISIYRSTTTQPDGSYQFIDIEPLGVNEDYFVYFPNQEMNDGCLGWWETGLISSLTSGQTVTIPVFDVANVQLVSPAPGAATTIPTTFQWNARPKSLDDNYELNLLDWETGYYMWWTDPTLGYTSSYRLTGLPSGLDYNYNYGWALWIYNNNGSGGSYYVQRIQFLNSSKIGVNNLYGEFQKKLVHDPLGKFH